MAKAKKAAAKKPVKKAAVSDDAAAYRSLKARGLTEKEIEARMAATHRDYAKGKAGK